MTEIYTGSHLIIDLWGATNLDDIKLIEITLKNIGFEGLVQFKSCGTCITASIISSGTHITIHTWPEHNYAAFDIFTSKNINHIDIAKILKESFNPARMVTQELQRGLRD